MWRLHRGGDDTSRSGAVAGPDLPPVGGLTELAAAQGWSGPRTDPPSAEMGDYVQKMLGYLWGGQPDYQQDVVAPVEVRYADLYRGTLHDRSFIVGNAATRLAGLYTHAGPGAWYPGTVCVVDLGVRGVTPLIQIGPRNREPYMRAMSRPVKLPSGTWSGRLELRSGHPDVAAAVVTPVAALLDQRDDWAFLIGFERLVSIGRGALVTAEDAGDRVEQVVRIASAMPVELLAAAGVPPPPLPDERERAELDTPENRERVRAYLDALPGKQRAEVMGRLRTEGPAALIREILGQQP